MPLTTPRTTDPPVLSVNHPIRKAFYRYGTNVSRHWLVHILLSVFIAVFVSYPVFFLYENPSSGFSKLPVHVWTSARRFEGTSSLSPDVEVRQVWIHGSYMKALDTSLLHDALDLQTALVFSEAVSPTDKTHPKIEESMSGADSCYPPSLVESSWGFHSPLMFWNCSFQTIDDDESPVKTVNGQLSRRSKYNLTLRATSVFAGKSFVDNKLIAADALVLTIFDSPGRGPTKAWDPVLARLASSQSEKWSFYPENGIVNRNQLYNFQWKPVSIRDDFLLFTAYLMMLVYLGQNLRRTRAVKSQLGIGVTVITQVRTLPHDSRIFRLTCVGGNIYRGELYDLRLFGD